MEEEFLKRNTDCVYFLASPLTCKKGIECEYRHSETARLNPKDCWYWLEGSCLNPICAFRHPPLGGDCEPSSQPAFYQSEPVNKTNVPCYFFFNGFCNKGDTCSFLHGPNHSSLAEMKSVKTVCAVKDAPLVKKKTLVESVALSAKTETHPCPAISDPQKESKSLHQFNKNTQQLAPNNARKNKPVAVRSEIFVPTEGTHENRSLDYLLFSDQSSDSLEDGYIASDDLVDDHTENEERWESSPGSDVIVENKLDDMGFEDDSEYAQTLEIEQSELNSDLMRYGYELQYDSTYPEDARIVYDNELCDSYDHLEKELSPDFAEKFPDCATSFSRKRKFLHCEPPVNKWRSTDLRDCLRRRMFIDDCSVNQISRRYTPPHLIAQIWERPRRHHRQSKVVDNITESRTEIKDHPRRTNRRSLFRPSQLNRSLKHVKVRKLAKFLAPGTLKETVPRSFSGPKTLSQIKKEKSVIENGDHFGKIGHPSKNSSKNFMGPMTLSEILLIKKKLGSTVNGGTIGSC